ncbi:hypothetical protein RND81_07G141300 [Saponaria officinalis]|uniref:Nucleolar protein 12 n=1 Tax=Saponaria officinalis TaxID=3572 RepID=A0AAW1JNA2_SAPOF
MEEEANIGGSNEPPSLSRSNDHIAKRALRNKSLSVSFDEKDLKDFVGGFQKRKKKRRKVALIQQGEADRRKRLEIRKQLRLDKEYALYGSAPPDKDGEAPEEEPEQNDESESELRPSISGTTTYENGDVIVTVTTSELNLEEEKDHPVTKSTSVRPVSAGAKKQQNIPVSKKKPFKKVRKGSSRPKLQNKRERRKGNKKKN